LILSGHRSYFYEQKANYLKQIDNLQKLNIDLQWEVKKLQDKLDENNEENIKILAKFQKELDEYKDFKFTNQSSAQTEIDSNEFKKYCAANEVININKKMVRYTFLNLNIES